MIDASRGPTRPRAPVSLVLDLGKDNDEDDGKEKNVSWCVSWADPPALPSVAAASSATATFTVTVAVAGRESTYDMAGTLPPRLCACEGWAPPEDLDAGESPPGDASPGESPPSDASSSNAEAEAFRSVTVSVVAENPGGSSSAASESVDLSRSDLDAWRAASRISCAVASPDDDVEEPPPGPPRDVRARWVGLNDGGSPGGESPPYIAIDWLPPLDAAGEDALETDGPVGYQVTWTQWDPRLFPAVDPPMSVVLADDERVRRAASSPCGSERNVEDGDGSGSSSCFFAGLATGLRLDGLDGSLALAIAVRAITTGGPGPLSAPVVTSPGSPAPPVEDEEKEPPGESPAGESPNGESPPGESPTGESPPGDASSVDGTVPPEAPRPVAPALDPPSVPAVVRLPLYEANRVGGVYEQMNNDYDNANGQGSGTAAFDAGGDFVEESTTEEVVGGGGFGGLGYGAYGGGFGYPFAGLGLGGLGLGGYRDGFYGGGGYGGGGGGNGTSVVVGGSTVTVILNVNENTTSTEDATTTPTPVPSPTPSPVPSPVPSPTPSPTPSPVPSPVPFPVPSPSPLVPELRKRGTKENPLPGEEKTVARVRVGSEPSAPGTEPAVVKIGDARNAPASVRETDGTSATSSAKPRTDPGSDAKVVPLDAKAREPPAAIVTTPTPTVIPLPADAGPRDSEAPAVVTLTEREKAKAAAAGKKTRVRGDPDADVGAETKPGRGTKPRGETKPRSSPEKKKKPKPTPDKVSEARAAANQRSSRGGGRKAGERGARQVSAQARKP